MSIATRQVASILGLITVFISSFSGGDAVVCYQCNSAFDPRCGDPFDPYSLGTVNCSLQQPPEHLTNVTPTLCRKITQKIYGKMRVVRGCGYITDAKDDKDCVRRSGTHDVLTHFCSCTSDLCNAATEQKPTFGTLLPLGIIAIVHAWTTN